MNGLAKFFELFIHGAFGVGPGFMAHVYGIGQEAASLADSLCVGAFLEVDAFGFQEVFDVTEQFFVIDFIHAQMCPFWVKNCKYQARGQLQCGAEFVMKTTTMVQEARWDGEKE